ncbi:MAG: hypothetical protein PHF56_21545 [Desulfuromonadaceae bacterium]|nr:hypothetical protein [Desulfuromonadaceae bacterium]
MKGLLLLFAMIVTVAGLSACGDSGTPAATATPTGTVVDLTAFKNLQQGIAAADSQLQFSLAGSDNQGAEYSGTYTLISDGTVSFEGDNRRKSRQIFTTQRGSDAPVTSVTTRYFDDPTGAFYKAVSDAGVVSTPAGTNLATAAIPASAKVGDFGTIRSVFNSDGTSYTFSWSLNADVDGASKLDISFFRTGTDTISGGIEVTTIYLDANGKPIKIELFLRTDTMRMILSGTRV